MNSNMYKGKINIIAVGLHKDEGLFIINNTEYITVHKKFISKITEMIQTPYIEKNEFKFQFFHVLDGVVERNCYIQLKDGIFIVVVDSITYEISESLLQSFTLIGFLKRFITIEEARNYKPNMLEAYNRDVDIRKQESTKCIEEDEDDIEEEEGEPYIDEPQVLHNVTNINDIRLQVPIQRGNYIDEDLVVNDVRTGNRRMPNIVQAIFRKRQ